MKKNVLYLMIAILAVSCGELDYKNKEFWKQEVYIISAESTAATERIISNTMAYTFSDTLRILNDAYETELIENNRPGLYLVKYKVGVGGSLAAEQDISVTLSFDQEILDDYNALRQTDLYIPDASLYSVNVPSDESAGTFTVLIPKGASSASLIFSVPILRDQMTKYEKFAFPLKIVHSGESPISRQYSDFMVAGLIVTTEKVTDWSGFPIPELPQGRWYSTLLAGNVNENTNLGVLRCYKYITKLGDTPDLVGKYMVWGTGLWAMDALGFNASGWHYNMLTLTDEVTGAYTMDPILEGNANFPMRTFSSRSVQHSTENNKYDPRTNTLTLHYANVLGTNAYTDVLTYVGDEPVYGPEYTEWTWPPVTGGTSCASWLVIRSKGYKYWLPIDGE